MKNVRQVDRRILELAIEIQLGKIPVVDHILEDAMNCLEQVMTVDKDFLLLYIAKKLNTYVNNDNCIIIGDNEYPCDVCITLYNHYL